MTRQSRFTTRRLVVIVAAGLLVLDGCASMSEGKNAFSLSTTAVQGPAETGFDSGLVSIGRLNAIYGAKAGDPANPRSFPFTWSHVPAGTKALAVVLDDPDARRVLAAYGRTGDFFLHWIATDIDPTLGGLPDNAAATMKITQGTNGAGNVGYQAPQPPADVPKDTTKVRIHVYRLKVYALSAPTGLAPGFTLDALMAAIKNTTLGMAQLNVSYSNQ
ncbi:MAG TPA: YbhB/YbcL family Raf kinase inhibitor-like protein [Spirochaetia bacterium]|nr:YbhB/YbcL family Raf kinase inhibitor-like protein [Spirochaetia bacterium]